MGLIDELKRRNVFRAASLYIVGAWLIIQIANNIFPAFEVPTWVYRTIIILLGIGFFPALAIAWAFKLTPKGLERSSKINSFETTSTSTAHRLNILLICTLVIALSYFMVDKFLISPSDHAQVVKSNQIALNASTAKQQPSIAVLPFDNRSALADDAFFVDGMQDDILTQLSKISGLKVISRTSVEKFRNTKLSIKDIAKQLGVTTILEGGVQRGGNKVRINMQLINAETEGHLWAETYDRELSAENIFAIQSEVTTAVTGALKAKLTAGEKAQLKDIPTKNLEAWEAYQIGKQRMANRNTQNVNEAEVFFRKAIKLDPTFVNAYAALVDTLRLKVTNSNANPEPIVIETDRLLKLAMSLDSNNAAVWVSAAGVEQIKGDYTKAESNFRKAILLDPNYVASYEWLSIQLSIQGKKDEALIYARKAVELDPLSAIVHASLAEILDNSEMYDEALESYQRAYNLDPTVSGVLVGQALILSYVKNRFPEALKILAQAKALDPGLSSIQAFQLSLYFDLMEDDICRKTLNDEIVKNPRGARDDTAIGLLSLIDGKVPEAMNFAQNTYKADPTNFWLLSTIYLYQGKPELSKKLYEKLVPEFFSDNPPVVTNDNVLPALDVAMIMIKLGDSKKAYKILDGVSKIFAIVPKLGFYGDGILEVEIIALRGDKTKALVALRQLQRFGWRGPNWRYYRDIDPAFTSIRNEPEFKAVFADIEKDMLRQREIYRNLKKAK